MQKYVCINRGVPLVKKQRCYAITNPLVDIFRIVSRDYYSDGGKGGGGGH